MNEILRKPIREIHQIFLSGDLRPSELYKICESRINPVYGAYISTCQIPEHHLVASDERYQLKKPKSLLDGIPLAVKDNFCIKNSVTSCASAMLANFKSPYTATVVQRALNAGVFVMGKTNLDEFAMGSTSTHSFYGSVKSIDGNRVVGGSSGGSAIAISSGSSLLSLGSDTGGSVRIPASWTGLCSFKPSYGLLSRHGLIALLNSCDVPGLMGRNSEDLEIFFRELIGSDPFDSTTIDVELKDIKTEDIMSLKIGVPKEFRMEDTSLDNIKVWSDVIDVLDSHNIQSSSVSLPHVPYAPSCYSILNCTDVASNMARYDGLRYGFRAPEQYISTEALFSDSRTAGFNSIVKSRIIAGNYFLLRENYDVYFTQAMKVRRLILQDYQKAFQSLDLMITPVTSTEAPKPQNLNTDESVYDYCVSSVNLAGLPAATIPISFSGTENYPIGIQVIGKQFEDYKVLKFCQWFQNNTKVKSI